MEHLLAGLNRAQHEAVTATEGYVRVIAGAGSGKTRALSHRFAYLVNELGILPGNILCVTFTNKSANEMRQRIHALTGDNDTGYINTFHGFCVSVLQEDSHAVQYPKSFLVLDNSDIDAMLGIIYEERGLTLRDMTYSAARDMIEIRKLFKEPEYYKDMITMSLDTLREKYERADTAGDIIFYGYLYQEKKCFGLDYNDLIKFSLYIFEQHEDIRLKWQQRLEYIMIDEFQDIDALQYELMEVLCGYHGNLFIVGDPDQTIYTWRGANVKYLLDFDKVFPNVQTIMMMENYRSTPEILAAANSLIAKNGHRIKKDLLPTKPSGEKVVCHFADTQEAEAHWMVGEMKRLHDRGRAAAGYDRPLPRALCDARGGRGVDARKNSLYDLLRCAVFRPHGDQGRTFIFADDRLSGRSVVPAHCQRAEAEPRQAAHGLFTGDGGKEGTSLYVTLKNHLEDSVFSGTKAKQFVDLIERFSHSYQGRPISEVLSDILDKSGYEKALRTEGSQERLDDLAELKQSIYEYETSCGEESTMEHYLAHIALFSNGDVAEQGDKVKLMTVHAAKGLEFPYVFLCGMNEGIFPSRKVRTLPGMEEERRLAFVALTRAEKGLYLSEADGWNFDGSPRYPSRFLLDIDRELLSFTHEVDETLLREAADDVARRDKYLREDDGDGTLPIGQRVRHAVFGEGTVLDVDLNKVAHVIQFDGMGTPRSISLRAKLEKIGP